MKYIIIFRSVKNYLAYILLADDIPAIFLGFFGILEKKRGNSKR